MVGVVRRIGGTAVAVLALAGCGGPVTLSAGHSAPSRESTRSSTASLPEVVDGVPLARLAQVAMSESQAFSEPRPWDVRAAIGSDRAANALQGRDGMTYDFGDTSTKYVVALDGQFRCGAGCSGSQFTSSASASPTTTTTVVPTTVFATSTMVLTVDPATVSLDGSFRLVDHEVDMASLGRVYSLDPYLGARGALEADGACGRRRPSGASGLSPRG